MTRRKQTGFLAALALAALVACGGDSPSSPEDPAPPEETPTPAADRVLPEGTYEVELSACGACSTASVPDYLAAFSDGVRGTIEISAATESTASLVLVEMRSLGSVWDDVLSLFGSSVIPLSWESPASEFRGLVDYGTAALFIASLRRSNGEIRCDFELFHAKHDVGATSCAVVD